MAAANPCPCGYLGSMVRPCICPPHLVQRYRAKISGPLLDRIDLHVEVPSLKIDEITETLAPCESSNQIRERVMRARVVQNLRFHELGFYENGQMTVRHIKTFCSIDKAAKELLKEAIRKLGLSARAYDRILRVARTVADLDGGDPIRSAHVGEAIGYRILDRASQQ